jgi:hypothetical protein
MIGRSFVEKLLNKENSQWMKDIMDSKKFSIILFIGFELTTCVFFQAIGKPVKAMILTLCKQTLFIVPLMIILPKFLGVLGVLYAGLCAELLSVIVTIIFITLELKAYSKLEV